MDILGANDSSYLIPYAQTDLAGSYTVVISNPAGSVTNEVPAVLTVDPRALGTVEGWGYDRRADVQAGVTAIAVAWSRQDMICLAHMLALKSDGSVVEGGYNQHTVPVAANVGVTAIAAGPYHSVALKSDGSVIAWGGNSSGQVDPRDTADPNDAIWSPVTLGDEILRGVTAIAAGDQHTVALKSDGTVVVWGNDDCGQVTGTPVGDRAFAYPVTLGGEVLREVTAIAAGYGYNLALKKDGTVVAWGNNRFGQVTGVFPTTTDAPCFAIASPVALGGEILRGVTAIAAGPYHAVALKSDGTVVAWGSNDRGQVTGDTDDSDWVLGTPVALGGKVLRGVTAIAAGRSQTVALKADGSVVAWPEREGALSILNGATAVAAGCGKVVLFGTAPPYLRLVPGPAGTKLAWPASATGYVVQVADRLDSPNW